MQMIQVLRTQPVMTDSVFTLVESWLYRQDSDHWHAIEELAPSRSLDSYASVVDFLLCEACPEQKKACRRFYAGHGKQLRELTTQAERDVMESKMLVLCQLAYESFCSKRQESWRTVRTEAWRRAA